MPDVKQPVGTSSPRYAFFPGHALLDPTASQSAWSWECLPWVYSSSIRIPSM